jgi:hypothetical protein
LIASGAKVAFGAPFFLWAASGGGVAGGVSVAVGLGVGAGVSVGFGEALDFFFFDGLPLGLALADSSGVGEADAFRFTCGDEVGEGDAFLADIAGEGDGAPFFVVAFFFFRAGVGVGVEKIFLIVPPIDCSARTGAAIDIIRAVAMNARRNIAED